MKIIFNASTNIIGGAIQTATNFISIAINDKDIQWLFVVSLPIEMELKKLGIYNQNFVTIPSSPARNKESRKELLNIEKEFDPSLIYTMSGPAYVKFNATHILGCSNPYVTHAEMDAFIVDRNIVKIIKKLITVSYQILNFKKANYWIFQTDSSRDGFVKRLSVPRNRTYVVSNTYGKLFEVNNFNDLGVGRKRINILVPSAAHKHKNLKIVPYVASYLKASHKNFQFLLTIPTNSKDWQGIKAVATKLGVEDHVKNNGPFSVSEGPDLYNACDVVFLPTLLETFSGTYVEAMICKKPLVTTDKSFAREICKDAALYFNSASPRDAASKLDSLLSDDSIRDRLIEKGLLIVNDVPTIDERYLKIKGILLGIKAGN